MGDGGALTTNDENLADLCRKIANHGQKTKYKYEMIGLNSRLDTLQAAILKVKLRHLPQFIKARQKAANLYDELLGKSDLVSIPKRVEYSDHVFHQYTVLFVDEPTRNNCKNHLAGLGIQTMIYYPQPLHVQVAFSNSGSGSVQFPVAENLCRKVLSLPMHSELEEEDIRFICQSLLQS
jgi:dTDP-4-amino-4,6-dideoxygalactose transaminase